jgi:hypothetical protein
VALELFGPTYYFHAPSLSGLVTQPPPTRDSLAEAMRAWLRGRGDAAEDASLRSVEIGAGRLEVVNTGADADYGMRPAGFIDHPSLMALFVADDEAALLSAARAAFERLEAGSHASIADAFAASSAAHQARGIETFIDYTSLRPMAERALDRAADERLFDPTELLGLEKDTTLYFTGDLHPGERIECRGNLNIPAGSVAAAIADSFGAVPVHLAASIPRNTLALVALNWNLAATFDRARAALEEAGHEEEAAQLGGAVEGASMMTGVDVEKSFLRQLDGNFVFFAGELAPVDKSAGDDSAGESEGIPPLGVELGILDRDAFEEFFDNLVDLSGQDLPMEQVHGTDAYVFPDMDGLDGGIAILPHTFLFATRRQTLMDSLAALTDAPESRRA